MDKTVPAPAGALLDFIGGIEAPQGYGTIYANKQGNLRKPLTSMTVDEVLRDQPGWSRAYGSSASGRYQFMNKTLAGLKQDLGLGGAQVFDANLQDRLGYHLLLRRGYAKFMAGEISLTEFGKRLAMEWASLPVLADTRGAHQNITRGQSYYAGDKLNKSLVKPERVEAVLSSLRTIRDLPEPAPMPVPRPIPAPVPVPAPVAATSWGPWIVAGLIVVVLAGVLIFRALSS